MKYECKRAMGARASRSPWLASRRTHLRQKKNGKCGARGPLRNQDGRAQSFSVKPMFLGSFDLNSCQIFEYEQLTQ